MRGRDVAPLRGPAGLPGVVALVAAVSVLGGIASPEPAAGQQVVDLRSGLLVVEETDLTVPAGAMALTVRRSLDPLALRIGPLGSRWRLAWERTCRGSGESVRVVRGGVPTEFARAVSPGAYRSRGGERLTLDEGGACVLHRRDGGRDHFGEAGELVAREDRNGNRIEFRYGEDGRLERVEGPRGVTLRLVRDASGRVDRVEGPGGRAVRYGYDGGELTRVEAPGAPPVRYGYDGSGRLARIGVEGAGEGEVEYDALGRVVARRWSDGAEERIEYDDASRTRRRVDPDGGVTTVTRSADGREKRVTDPWGATSRLRYDAAGRLVHATDAAGGETSVEYDELGRPVRVREAGGAETRFEYVDDSQLPAAVTEPDGTRREFAYDDRLNLVAVRVGGETVARYEYTEEGLLSRVSQPGGRVVAYGYDTEGRLSSVTDAAGGVTRLEYDAAGRVVREVTPAGGVTRRSYDDAGRLARLVDPRGAVTRVRRDEAGRPVAVVGPLGGETRIGYDGSGRRISETDPAGATTRIVYDGASGELAVRGPDGAAAVTRFGAGGRILGAGREGGGSVSYEHDELGRVTVERWSSGLDVHYAYDEAGRVQAVRDNAGGSTRYERDAAGRPVRVEAGGSEFRYTYDARGRLVSEVDPRGEETRFAYAPAGELAEVRTPGGGVARYEHDAAGRLTAIRHPGGGESRYEYGPLGNVVLATDPAGVALRREYDEAGKLVRSTGPAGLTTAYRYDAAGRLVTKELPHGGSVRYEYGPRGELLRADDGAFPVRYAYDDAGRLAGLSHPAVGRSVTYRYDEHGRRSRLRTSSGATVGYTYDEDGRPAAIRLPGGDEISLAFDPAGRVVGVRYPNGVEGRWEYDPAGRVASLRYSAGDGAVLAGWRYERDEAGNPTRVERARRSGSSYVYDADGRLVEESGDGRLVRFEYGPDGERALRREASGSRAGLLWWRFKTWLADVFGREPIPESPGVTLYEYGPGGRLARAGNERFEHDARGHLTGRSGAEREVRYEYDAEGRLVRATGAAGGDVRFGYTPTGERAWRRDGDGVTYFLYDGPNLLETVEEDGGATLYVHGPGLDWPLALVRAGETFFYHVDGLGNVALLTDEAGRPSVSYRTDAFGVPLGRTGRHPGNPFLHGGRPYDPDLGLYYQRARYYDPGLGRFLSPDPLEPALDDPATLDPYVFARSAPTRYGDPLGLAPVETGSPYQWTGEDMRHRWLPGNSDGWVDHGRYQRRWGLSPTTIHYMEMQEAARLRQELRNAPSPFRQNYSRAEIQAMAASRVEGALNMAESRPGLRGRPGRPGPGDAAKIVESAQHQLENRGIRRGIVPRGTASGGSGGGTSGRTWERGSPTRRIGMGRARPGSATGRYRRGGATRPMPGRPGRPPPSTRRMVSGGSGRVAGAAGLLAAAEMALCLERGGSWSGCAGRVALSTVTGAAVGGAVSAGSGLLAGAGYTTAAAGVAALPLVGVTAWSGSQVWNAAGEAGGWWAALQEEWAAEAAAASQGAGTGGDLVDRRVASLWREVMKLERLRDEIGAQRARLRSMIETGEARLEALAEATDAAAAPSGPEANPILQFDEEACVEAALIAAELPGAARELEVINREALELAERRLPFPEAKPVVRRGARLIVEATEAMEILHQGHERLRDVLADVAGALKEADRAANRMPVAFKNMAVNAARVGRLMDGIQRQQYRIRQAIEAFDDLDGRIRRAWSRWRGQAPPEERGRFSTVSDRLRSIFIPRELPGELDEALDTAVRWGRELDRLRRDLDWASEDWEAQLSSVGSHIPEACAVLGSPGEIEAVNDALRDARSTYLLAIVAWDEQASIWDERLTEIQEEELPQLENGRTETRETREAVVARYEETRARLSDPALYGAERRKTEELAARLQQERENLEALESEYDVTIEETEEEEEETREGLDLLGQAMGQARPVVTRVRQGGSDGGGSPR